MRQSLKNCFLEQLGFALYSYELVEEITTVRIIMGLKGHSWYYPKLPISPFHISVGRGFSDTDGYALVSIVMFSKSVISTTN